MFMLLHLHLVRRKLPWLPQKENTNIELILLMNKRLLSGKKMQQEKGWKGHQRGSHPNRLKIVGSKCAEVVQLLIHSLILTSKEKILTPESIKCNSKSSDDTVRMVEEFFEDDANLQVMPGKKDILSVKAGTGLKEKNWKRLLLDGIDNLHYKYNSTPPKNKVGRSKFFALRPFWAIPVWKQLQDVYNYVYHENNDLICESLEKFARKKKLFLDFKSTNSANAIWIPSVW